MHPVSELVEYSRLDARIYPTHTVHIHHEPGRSASLRRSRREERWEWDRPLGRGSYGSVWLEKCVLGQNEVKVRAVKEIRKPQQSINPVDHSRELEAIAKFSHSRYEGCFVEFLGWYESPQAVYIAMEYLHLGDLQSHLNTNTCLEEPDARSITFQILEGLFYMHKTGFAHRDLKPSNVLIKSKPPARWWIKLCDFGISKRVEGGVTESTLKGTLAYMAPEMLGYVDEIEDSRGNEQAADVWALGEMVFRMLTGGPTFTKGLPGLGAYCKGREGLPLQRIEDRGIGLEVCYFVSRLMSPIPSDRLTVEEAFGLEWMSIYDRPVFGQSQSQVYTDGGVHRSNTISTTGKITEPSANWTTQPNSPQLRPVASRNSTIPESPLIEAFETAPNTLNGEEALPFRPQPVVQRRAVPSSSQSDLQSVGYQPFSWQAESPAVTPPLDLPQENPRFVHRAASRPRPMGRTGYPIEALAASRRGGLSSPTYRPRVHDQRPIPPPKILVDQPPTPLGTPRSRFSVPTPSYIPVPTTRRDRRPVSLHDDEISDHESPRPDNEPAIDESFVDHDLYDNPSLLSQSTGESVTSPSTSVAPSDSVSHRLASSNTSFSDDQRQVTRRTYTESAVSLPDDETKLMAQARHSKHAILPDRLHTSAYKDIIHKTVQARRKLRLLKSADQTLEEQEAMESIDSVITFAIPFLRPTGLPIAQTFKDVSHVLGKCKVKHQELKGGFEGIYNTGIEGQEPVKLEVLLWKSRKMMIFSNTYFRFRRLSGHIYEFEELVQTLTTEFEKYWYSRDGYPRSSDADRFG